MYLQLTLPFESPATKCCNKCGVSKDLAAFYIDRHSPDGHRYSCIDCDKLRKRTAEVREQSKRYYHSEKGKAAEQRYRTSEKYRATAKAYRERPDVIARKTSPEGRRKSAEATRRWQLSARGQAILAAKKATPEWQERRKAYIREYHKRPEAIERRRAQGRRWWNEGPGKEWTREYLADPQNKERYLASHRRAERRRHALKRRLPATLTEAQWQAALAYFAGRCAYCGSDGPLVQEHFVPVTAGGPYAASNIVPACVGCNQSKYNRLPQKWCPPDVYERVTTYFASLRD